MSTHPNAQDVVKQMLVWYRENRSFLDWLAGVGRSGERIIKAFFRHPVGYVIYTRLESLVPYFK